MRSQLFIWCVAAAALPLCAAAAHGQIVNGSFESGLAGWNTAGHVTIDTLGLSAPDGAAAVFMSTSGTSGAVSAADLENALGLFNGAIGALVNTTSGVGPTNGSGIGQLIEVPAGATSLNFNFNFLTNEVANDPQWNDTAFWSMVGLHNGLMMADTFSTPFSPGVGGFNNMTGYVTANFGMPALAGTYMLGFGVVNVHDVHESFNSALLLDNIHFTVVPEPGSLGLLGLAGLAVLRRRH